MFLDDDQGAAWPSAWHWFCAKGIDRKNAATEHVIQPQASSTNGLCCLFAGRNNNGQLGVGGTADVQEPQVMQVSLPCRFSACSCNALLCSHAARARGSGDF